MSSRSFLYSFFKMFSDNNMKSATMRLYATYIGKPERFKPLFMEYFSLPISLVFGESASDKDVMLYLLGRYYRNERFIKHAFEKSIYIGKGTLFAEELPCLNSRVDIACIGNGSCAYEIKTHYDRLDRLVHQVEDYSKCFEYVYVVCSMEKVGEVLNLVPEHCGVISYQDSSRCFFRVTRKSSGCNHMLSPYSQLSCMRKTDMRRIFRTADPDEIIHHYSASLINEAYKKLLHSRISAISSR